MTRTSTYASRALSAALGLTLALSVGAGLTACAHGPAAPEASAPLDDGEIDAGAFAALAPGDQLALAGDRVMSLRTTLARVFARIDALRDAVRMRDALADWGQLVCLEERVPDVRGYARRGERAWDALREAVRGGDREAVWIRFELLRLARLGVSKELAAARACGSVAPGAVRPQRVVRVEPTLIRQPDPSAVVGRGVTARELDAAPSLPAVFVPTPY